MSGAAIKRIAVITMLTDHLGAAFFYIFTSSYDGTAAFAGADLCYQMLRIVGRTSFPLFCFLIVEGFLHTRSMGRYMLRLFVFALLSELPFDLAFHDSMWDMSMQNVFFTLLFGLLALFALRWGQEKCMARAGRWKLCYVTGWIGAAVCVCVAQLFRTDYGGVGVVLILVLYLLRNERVWACMGGYAVMCLGGMESWCFPAFLFFLPVYNGERGTGSKYFFYFFYPVHLLALAGVRILCL